MPLNRERTSIGTVKVTLADGVTEEFNIDSAEEEGEGAGEGVCEEGVGESVGLGCGVGVGSYTTFVQADFTGGIFIRLG